MWTILLIVIAALIIFVAGSRFLSAKPGPAADLRNMGLLSKIPERIVVGNQVGSGD